VHAIYAWLRRHPIFVDSVLALVLFLLGLGATLRQPLIYLPLTLLMTVPVAFRRRAPMTAFLIAAFAGLVQLIQRAPATGSDLTIPVLLYAVAAYRPRRYAAAAAGICVIGSIAAMPIWAPTRAAVWHEIITGSIILGGCILIAWVLGDSMHYRRGYYAALEDRAARLEVERDAHAAIAAAAERARIARELHDVVAHNVSVMVVQADGASYALDTDPARARAALAAISDTGRQALTEMRRLLGVLRTGDERAALAPLPGLDELRELVEQARSAGLAVTLRLRGAPRELPEGAELAAYRVVQEALTNTRKHAGLAASAAVMLSYEPDNLVVQVTDNGQGGGIASDTAGHGLIGMRERIEMYGGVVQAGPLAGGGFGVTATLPCPGGDSAQRAGRRRPSAASLGGAA
jgi:signal transduction histidine kinase